MEKRMCYGGKAVYANISLINLQAFNGLSRGGRGGRGAGAVKGKENIKSASGFASNTPNMTSVEAVKRR